MDLAVAVLPGGRASSPVGHYLGASELREGPRDLVLERLWSSRGGWRKVLPNLRPREFLRWDPAPRQPLDEIKNHAPLA